MEPATGIEPRSLASSQSRSLALTKGASPLYDPPKGTNLLRIPSARWFISIGRAPGGFAIWSRRLESNQRPAVYETAALPTELRRLFGKKRPYPITGFSQASRGISLRGPFEK